MTQEEKETLLHDLCGRLPYKVKVTDEMGRIYNLVLGNADLCSMFYEDEFDNGNTPSYCIPYLRPLASMTDKEREEYRKFSYYGAAGIRTNDFSEMVAVPSFEKMDYLNSHHFDYRGLIEKGLALEAPEGMYKFE